MIPDTNSIKKNWNSGDAVLVKIDFIVTTLYFIVYSLKNMPWFFPIDHFWAFITHNYCLCRCVCPLFLLCLSDGTEQDVLMKAEGMDTNVAH